MFALEISTTTERNQANSSKAMQNQTQYYVSINKIYQIARGFPASPAPLYGMPGSTLMKLELPRKYSPAKES